jgi:hypothetical protein
MAPEPYRQQLQDTIVVPQLPDTVVSSRGQQGNTPSVGPDSASDYTPAASTNLTIPRSTLQIVVPQNRAKDEQAAPSQQKTTRENWNTGKNFLQENGLTGIVTGTDNQHFKANAPTYAGTIKPQKIELLKRNLGTHDWLLGIFMLLVILFVWIRIFYSKFFATLANALVSYHISAKLYQEKNVLSQRVSIVLDFIYLIVFSVFLYEIVTYQGYSGSTIAGLRLFLILLNIVMLYAMFRLFMLRFTGYLFLSRSLYGEYLHNTLVVNKGLGIVLFPVVIMVHYLPYKLIPVLLVIGVIVFIVGIIWKTFRAYQIIIRRDVLLFYLILYLCTLEILPLLLGYKFVRILIQSN